MGAAPTHVAWFFARRALGPPLAGILAGLGGALALYGALTKVVAGIDRWDSASFAWTPAMLLAAALAAVVIPLRRALRIDPAVSLRSD